MYGAREADRQPHLYEHDMALKVLVGCAARLVRLQAALHLPELHNGLPISVPERQMSLDWVLRDNQSRSWSVANVTGLHGHRAVLGIWRLLFDTPPLIVVYNSPLKLPCTDFVAPIDLTGLG